MSKGGSWWAPKPLNKQESNPIFKMHEPETVVKSLNPLERQRAKDGSPADAYCRGALRPADPSLYVQKGSLVQKVEEEDEGGRSAPPKADPPVYNSDKVASIVKSYLLWSGE